MRMDKLATPDLSTIGGGEVRQDVWHGFCQAIGRRPASGLADGGSPSMVMVLHV